MLSLGLMLALASSAQAAPSGPGRISANPTPHPGKKISANPTPHPKIITPHPGGKISANPTPHPYPVPVIDVFVVRNRLVVKMRTPDGKRSKAMSSARSLTGLSYPTLNRSTARGVSKMSARKSVRPSNALLVSIGCNGIAGDGENTWKIAPTSTFLFADGLKITTRGTHGGNYCESVEVMSGDGRVRVTTNGPTVVVGRKAKDRWKADAKSDDGLVYFQGVTGDGGNPSWATIRTSRNGARMRGPAIVFDAGDGVSKRTGVRYLSYELTNVMITSLIGEDGLQALVGEDRIKADAPGLRALVGEDGLQVSVESGR